LRVWGSRFETEGLGIRVEGVGFRVQGSGFEVRGEGLVEALHAEYAFLQKHWDDWHMHPAYLLWCLGFRVQGSGFRVQV
jgi:hypothetical protein